MKFPGKRKFKHYFPVGTPRPFSPERDVIDQALFPLVGIEQTLVDVEAQVSYEFMEKYGLTRGVSAMPSPEIGEAILADATALGLIRNQQAGSTVGNTLHNFSILADAPAIQLGVMANPIHFGSSAYHFLRTTSTRVNLDHMQPVTAIGRALTLITPDGERSFVILPGDMDNLSPQSIPEAAFKQASAVLFNAYLFRTREHGTIFQAMEKCVQHAKAQAIPVGITLGTHHVVSQYRDEIEAFIKAKVNLIACNEEEAEALTGESDPLSAMNKLLDMADMVLLTAGPAGLYFGGHTDSQCARITKYPLKSGAIPEFNRYEFSRPLLKDDCDNPIKVISHINPFMGGPERIVNTNGAGDGALAALLHDMAANHFHHQVMPSSSKHDRNYMTYSSFAQVCKYANRVSYEILVQSSPRLAHGLPEREDSLEEAYWDM
jgi:inosine kinase